ncbi:hybrid sensor histidine kinase/response regulator transcription factor [Paenibacillus sp. chi10]|uniref:Hybrid sensor histidine kinase/response regulator transcription factor n=1 Tax=Paenibacillus suaedae TaxID=3077233 RepID=A0AAJ2JYG6_9BACL|nr:hybrid sensor histidine kinase/response regulator transcription factor [Paenibacillus sp. chi10]MDT8978064.1 hybrid sensor histidine kinase/response regulator transcription factor [Paenibacillus sp. chi10]
MNIAIPWTKQRAWYDWAILVTRFYWLISASVIVLAFREEFPHAMWMLCTLALLVYPLPLLLRFGRQWHMLAEILLVGVFSIWISAYLPLASWQFLMAAFVFGFLSSRNSLWWTAPLVVICIPFSLGMAVNSAMDEILLRYLPNNGLAYFLGFAFQLLALTHKQGLIIQEQNRVLEHHVTQVERLTLIEERSRLSHELHDTIGHTLTSVIMGLESMRPAIPASHGEQYGEIIVRARKGLDDIRTHLHELSPDQMDGTLSESINQLSNNFYTSTGIKVKLRVLGTECPVTKHVSHCLYRCLQEALTNAVRHGQATSIDISLYYDEEWLRLHIEDNGQGMEQVQYGYGLSGMKDRLLALGGNLSIHSVPREGTVVVCKAPLIMPAPNAAVRVLIVDDRESILHSLHVLLTKHPEFEVVGAASNGRAALEQCERFHPDLVLMDVKMPKMDGITALQTMKQRWPDLKIAFLTTFPDVGQAMTALKHGANGYMLKSVHPKELIEAIKLINNGGTWIAEGIAEQVFAGMKQSKTSNIENSAGHIQDNPYGLTQREHQVLHHLSLGLRYKSIAKKLFLSEGTVRNYCSILYSKLNVGNREEAVLKGKQENLC